MDAGPQRADLAPLISQREERTQWVRRIRSRVDLHSGSRSPSRPSCCCFWGGACKRTRFSTGIMRSISVFRTSGLPGRRPNVPGRRKAGGWQWPICCGLCRSVLWRLSEYSEDASMDFSRARWNWQSVCISLSFSLSSDGLHTAARHSWRFCSG